MNDDRRTSPKGRRRRRGLASRLGDLTVGMILASPLHGLLGDRFAVVKVRGLKSGRPVTTPVNVRPDGDRYTVVSRRERVWWRNLRGGQPAALVLRGIRRPVRGEVIESAPQVADALARHVARYPDDARALEISLDGTGQPLHDDLQRAADTRVLVLLRVV
ncbi:MAG: nitroreductase/quinone reductase family protein [Anaerolineales bacterium]